MYIAVEHVNNFPITLTIEWNDNGDICIHAGNLFSHYIFYVTSKNKKKTKTKEKIQMCQMDIIRVCCLLGSVKKKKNEEPSFSRGSHRIFMTFRPFCSTPDRNGF